MKQQEIELLLRNKGYERGVREALFRIAEEQNDIRREMTEMAAAIYSMSSVIDTLNMVATGMKNKIDRLAMKEDDGRSTRSVIEGD